MGVVHHYRQEVSVSTSGSVNATIVSPLPLPVQENNPVTNYALEAGGVLDAIKLSQTDGTQHTIVDNFPTEYEISNDVGNPIPTTETNPITNYAIETGGVLDDIELNTEQTFLELQETNDNIGDKTDAVATTDTGSFSILAFIKRGLQNWTTLFGLLPSSLTGSGNFRTSVEEPLPAGTNSIGQVTANAGTDLNTSALNLEATQLGVKTNTDNLDVTLSTRLSEADFDDKIGAKTETAPASDTASSGLNGRLQRVAQRLTTFLALLPSSLGQKANTTSFAVALSTEQEAILSSISSGVEVLSLGINPSFSVGSTFVPTITSPTDVFTISGSATKTVLVTKIRVSFSSTAEQIVQVSILKRSTANTGGTSTTPNIPRYDTTKPAATAVVRVYTSNPTLGTLVGSFREQKLTSVASPVKIQNILTPFEFGATAGSPLYLRGVDEVLCVNLNGGSLGVQGSASIDVEFIEI